MTDNTVSTAPAPSSLGLNFTTTVRALLAMIAGYLIQTHPNGALNSGNEQAFIGMGLMVATLGWGYVKNMKAISILKGWMTSAPVQLVARDVLSLSSLPRVASTILPLMLLGISLTACVGLSNYFTPLLQADQQAVENATLVISNDLIQAKADYANNKAALPADAAKLASDQAVATSAWEKWIADLKAAGQPAPVKPTTLTATIPTS